MMNENIDKLLNSLGNSKFRGSFHLNNKMKEYVLNKGMDVIESHARDFINKNLKPAYIPNDGKQTPMKQIHPVFIARHATGTCCRGCLERIHHIEKNRELSEEEVNYVIEVIMKWIKREV